MSCQYHSDDDPALGHAPNNNCSICWVSYYNPSFNFTGMDKDEVFVHLIQELYELKDKLKDAEREINDLRYSID